jgi:polysaccharide biosynthesis transport protein
VSGHEEHDLREVIATLRRRSALLLMGALAGLLVAAALDTVLPPVYRATTRLEVRKEPTRSPLTGEVVGGDEWQSDLVTLYTSAEMLTGRDVLASVTNDLAERGLASDDDTPPLLRSLKTRWRGLAGVAFAAGVVPEHASRSEREREMLHRVDRLARKVRAVPVKDTRLVSLQVEDHDPQTARAIAASVVHHFIEQQVRQREMADTGEVAYLSRQAGELRAQVSEAESSLYNATPGGLIATEGRLERLGAQVTDLNAAYVTTTTERFATEARLAQAEQLAGDSLADGSRVVDQSGAMEPLRQQLLACQRELVQARGMYRAQHPKLLELEAQERTLRQALHAEIEGRLHALRSEREMLVERERNLRMALARGEQSRGEAGEQSRRFATLEGALKTKRDLYALVLTKLQEARVASAMRPPQAEMVEPVTVDPRPVRPRPLLDGVIGALSGLLAGVALAFALEASRRTFHTPDDVKRYLQLDVIGLIPRRS